MEIGIFFSNWEFIEAPVIAGKCIYVVYICINDAILSLILRLIIKNIYNL